MADPALDGTPTPAPDVPAPDAPAPAPAGPAPVPQAPATPTPPYPSSSPSPSPAPAPSPDLVELREGLCGDEVRRRLGQAARHEEVHRRVLAFYLVEMETRRLYQSTGHASTAQYAEARLGLDRRRVAELLRVGAQLLHLRHVDRAFGEGRLGWAKVLVLARMATPPHEAAWLERALALDVRELTLLAARSREGGPPRAAGDEKGLPEIRFPVGASVPPLVHAKLEQSLRRLGDEFGRTIDFAGLLETLLDEFLATDPDGSKPGRKRLDASAYQVRLLDTGRRGDPLLVETQDGPLPVDGGGPGAAGALSEAVRCDAGVRTHHGAGGADTRARDGKTPSRMRRQVLRRDGERCRACGGQRSLMVHHVEFRAQGGRTHPRNLVTACSRCHGLVHAGLLVVEGDSAEAARFVDATGRPVNGPDPVAEIPAALLAPVVPGPRLAGTGEATDSPPPVVTLAAVPDEVDAAWWGRHAHLVRDRGDQGGLRFEAGPARDAPPPPTRPPAPAAEAFAGLVGQEDRVARLLRTAEGARARGRRFPHVLLTGPAGTGKTTLARGIAAAADQPLAEVSAPLVTDRATWVRLLAGLAHGSVLFLDEAHALARPLQDALLEAMAERRLSLVLSDGTTARRVTLRLPAFTLVAATTDEGAIPPALRSRFGLRETLVHYGEDVLVEVVRGAAAKEGAEATPEGARRLARASRGVPREALRLLDRALDDAAVTGTPRLDAEGAERCLAGLGYDAEGLDPGERRYVEILRESPTPVPLSRLARALGTTVRTLIEHVEPWLFRRGLVRMTPGGRTVASRARLVGGPSGAPIARRGPPLALRPS